MSDLMFQDEIREVVRTAYGAIPAGAGRAIAERLYSPDELAAVPEEAIEWALGVGNPVRHAALRPAEVVLDVGCGGGIDAILAARRTGPDGRVIGVDLLPEMCRRAEAAARAAGLADRCSFEAAEMEDLPLPDASVDVVISNGTLNLSPRKSRALAEIARVLRPGGRLCVADLTVDDDLPPEVLASGASWAGCIAGALSRRVLRRKLERVGLVGVHLEEPMGFGIDDVALYPLFTHDVLALMRRVLPAVQQERLAVSLVVRALKPGGAAAPAAAAGVASRRNGDGHGVGVAARVTPLADLDAETLHGAGVTVRQLKRVEDVALKVLDVDPGGSTPFHTHPHAHEGVIVSGAGTLRLGERGEDLRAGDVFSVAPGQPHAIASEAERPLRFVCMDCFIED
jgi:arsenite methyltransferase